VGSNRRRLLLILILCVMVGLVVRDRMRVPSVAMVTSPSRAVSGSYGPNESSQQGVRLVLDLDSREEYAHADGNAFPSARREPIPVQLEVQPPPPSPKAPPLPFTFIGKEFGAGAWRVFLAQQDAVLVATEGGLLTEEYKVTKIHPPTMEFLYLPLNETQVFGIGAPHND
jgi:hypothetical protein